MKSKNSVFLFLSLFVVFLACRSGAEAATTPEFKLSNKRVLWLGDSITQIGDYVTFAQYYLDKIYPSDKIDIVSIGLASETVSGLSEKAHPFPRPCVLERLQRALDKVKPDVVVACYGMNDGIYHPQSDDRMQAFEDGINKLISACREANAQLVLLTPPPFDKVAVHDLRPKEAPDFSYMSPYEDYDSVLGDYAKWEMSQSSDGVAVIDLHTAFSDYLAKRRETDPHFSFTQDGIHPMGAGQLLMAEIILKGLNVPITFNDDLDAEFAQTTKDPLFALVKAQRENRSNGWLPYVGYTRDKKVTSESVGQTEQANADLQAKIDGLRKASAPASPLP